jgi:RNA polymerase sigma-70 factor (ECF subfamily)
VFLLHDVFGFEFEEVAATVDRSPANARQIAVRARKHVEARRPRFDPSPEHRQELAARFFAAVMDGDVEGLMEMLADDVTMVGDGGGHGALREPVTGSVQAARFLAGLGRLAARQNLALEPILVNGQPGAVAYAADGSVMTVMTIDVVDNRVAAVRAVVNPDKLRHVAPRR